MSTDTGYGSIEWRSHPLLAIVLGVLIVLPLVAQNPFIRHIFVMAFLGASVAAAWNIVGGYLGLLSLAHGVFFGMGAYFVILTQKSFGLNPWLAIIGAILLTVIVAAVVFHPTFRLGGHFFALGSLAFIVIAENLAVYFSDITGGSRGVFYYGDTGLINFSFNSKLPFYYIGLVYLGLSLYIAYRLRWSKRGFYFIAIREDQEAAEALGINPALNKHLGLAISVALTTFGGGFYAQYNQYLDPATAFSLFRSINFVIFSIAGGIGTVVGPALGAMLLQPIQILSNTLLGSRLGGIGYMIYGVLLIFIIIFAPDGINARVLSAYRFVNDRLASIINDRLDLGEKTHDE